MKEKTFRFIKQFIEKNGYSPTVREICKGVGVESTATVSRYLQLLEGDGCIRSQFGKSRTIVILKELEAVSSGNPN